MPSDVAQHYAQHQSFSCPETFNLVTFNFGATWNYNCSVDVNCCATGSYLLSCNINYSCNTDFTDVSGNFKITLLEKKLKTIYCLQRTPNKTF